MRSSPARGRMLIVTLAVLAAGCGETPPTPADARRYTPMEVGTHWLYDVRAGQRRWKLDMKREGGDLRTLDGVDVPYLFVYGKPGDTGEYRAKSIYAARPDGLAEMYLDGYTVSIGHEPPVVLLAEARVGATWTWRGTLSRGNSESEREMHVAVTARETVRVGETGHPALRVEERCATGDLTITRWFARDVGLVKLRVEAKGAEATKATAFEMIMLEHRAPSGKPAGG